MSLLLSLNPYLLMSVLLSALVFIVLLRRPKWLGRVSPDATVIAGLATLGSGYFLYKIGPQSEYQGLWALSVLVSLGGAALTILYRKQPARAFKLVCIVFMIIFWALLAYRMLRTPTLLDTDERHYLSIAAVATGGHGLYPALQNYPSIPQMGGVGYMAWIYVLAYQILGPSLYSLRLVALLFSLLSLPPIFLLFRRWYGPVTAWLAVTLLPTSILYISIFSIRMDIFTITCLWWGLLLVDVAREKNDWRWHLAAGLYMALCLQAHIHTSVTTVAIGLLYLADTVRQARLTRHWGIPSAVLAYSGGVLIGLGVFLVANVLPNPDAFFRTAGNAARFAVVEVDPNASLMDRLIRSLTAVDVFATSFLTRWVVVLESIHPVELILWITAFIRLFLRRSYPASRTTIILSFGVLIAGFVILNHYVLPYTTHIGPVLLLCVPPFFISGFSRRTSFEWNDIPLSLVLVLAVCVLPIYMTSVRIKDTAALIDPTPQEAAAIQYVKDHVSTNCKLMGPDAVFVFDLPMYTWYHTGDNSLGRRYYNFDSDDLLWQAVDPDIVLATEGVLESLKTWIVAAEYKEIGPSVWQKTRSPLSADCQVTS